jgi:hypothetical protein
MTVWAEYQYLSLSTQKRDGSWVATPVWFAQKDGVFYCFSESKAGKVKRIRNFSEVKITPCTLTGKLIGDTHTAQAQLIDQPEALKYAHKALIASYGWKMRGLDLISRMFGKIDKRAFIKITPNP